MRAWKHDLEVAADSGHGRVVGAKRRLADRQRPLILFSRTFQAGLAVGWTLERTVGHPLGHPAGPPSRVDTLAWSVGRHERTPRRTATAAGRGRSQRYGGRATRNDQAITRPSERTAVSGRVHCRTP